MSKYAWGICMMKDEQDVAYHTIVHMAEEGLAGIIVADNMSNDGTRKELEKARDVLKDGPCRVIIIDDNEPGYYQSKKMTALARKAHDMGATWIVPFDADELWYGHDDRLAYVLCDMPDEVHIVEAPLYNHFPTSIDPGGITPFKTIRWRQPEPGALPKVAVRWREDLVINQGNHSATYTKGLPEGAVRKGDIELRHFPYRTFEQFKNKAINGARAYQSTNLAQSEGAHWRQYGAILEKWGEDVFRREVWERYFWFYAPVEAGMIQDPAPFRRWNKNG